MNSTLRQLIILFLCAIIVVRIVWCANGYIMQDITSPTIEEVSSYGRYGIALAVFVSIICAMSMLVLVLRILKCFHYK